MAQCKLTDHCMQQALCLCLPGMSTVNLGRNSVDCAFPHHNCLPSLSSANGKVWLGRRVSATTAGARLTATREV